MSSAWPIRPSGDCVSTHLRKSLSVKSSGLSAFGFDHSGIEWEFTRILRGPEFLGEHAGDGINRGLGGGVDGSVGGGLIVLTPEPTLMMLPPSGPMSFTAS